MTAAEVGRSENSHSDEADGDARVGALRVALVGGGDLHIRVGWSNDTQRNVGKEVAHVLLDRGGIWNVVLDNGQHATIRCDAITCVTYLPGRGRGAF